MSTDRGPGPYPLRDATRYYAPAYRTPEERGPAWRCACPTKKKHRLAYNCLSALDLAAWREAHPDATVSDAGARALAWLDATFGGKR